MEKCNLIPKDGSVILERVEADTKTKSGIFIPDTAQDKKAIGIIKAVGYSSLGLKVGDKVMFTTFAGNTIKYKEFEYLIIDEDDLLAVVSE